MGLCSFLWRHKRAIATTSVVAAGGYCAYRLYQKKRELDDLIDSLGLQQLFGDDSGATRQSKEERCRRAALRRPTAIRRRPEMQTL